MEKQQKDLTVYSRESVESKPLTALKNILPAALKDIVMLATLLEVDSKG